MSAPKFLRAVLVLPIRDMKVSRDWYAHALGFETVYLHDDPIEDPEGNYAVLRRDSAELHLILDEPPREHPWTTAGSGYLFLLVREVEAMYQQVLSKGVSVTKEIMTTNWGARAFELTDPSGNLILVAQDVSA